MEQGDGIAVGNRSRESFQASLAKLCLVWLFPVQLSSQL